MGFRGFILILGIFGTTSCLAAPSFYLNKCGDYEVSARMSCAKGECSLTLLPGSQAQTVLKLRSTPLLYPQYNGAFIRTRIRVSSLAHTPVLVEALDAVPRRVVPSWTQKDLHRILARKCGQGS